MDLYEQIKILDKLKAKRREIAEREGVELYRVFTNETLTATARAMPKTKEELLKIKGWGEKKLAKYGNEILALLNSNEEIPPPSGTPFRKGRKIPPPSGTPFRKGRKIPPPSGTPHSSFPKGGGRRTGGFLPPFVKSPAFPPAPKWLWRAGQAPPLEKGELEVPSLRGGGFSEKGEKSFTASGPLPSEKGEKIFRVGVYLDLLNIGLKKSEARVLGEVSSVKEQNGVFYFVLKDKEDGSVLNCVMWRSDYDFCGVKLKEGIEVIVSGYPNIYKPSGKLSMKAQAVELLGEGALKKAYDELKAKLEREGIFAAERKRPLPKFPEKIGLITSREGDAISDFLNNLGRYGFKVYFKDSRVEGQRALRELTEAIRFFEKSDIDVLVIIRGGGAKESFENLLSFNNEALVKEIAKFPFPVLVGIGHHKNVPLAALAADFASSTPSMAAMTLNKSWDEAKAELDGFEYQVKDFFRVVFERVRNAEKNFAAGVEGLKVYLEGLKKRLAMYESGISAYNPDRQIRLGYSIVKKGGRILRSVKDVRVGDKLDLKLADGTIDSEVKKVTKL